MGDKKKKEKEEGSITSGPTGVPEGAERTGQ